MASKTDAMLGQLIDMMKSVASRVDALENGSTPTPTPTPTAPAAPTTPVVKKPLVTGKVVAGVQFSVVTPKSGGHAGIPNLGIIQLERGSAAAKAAKSQAVEGKKARLAPFDPGVVRDAAGEVVRPGTNLPTWLILHIADHAAEWKEALASLSTVADWEANG